MHNLAPRIKAKTIIQTGLMDNICPPSTQNAIYNNLACEKEHLLYPNYGHEAMKSAADRAFMHFLED